MPGKLWPAAAQVDDNEELWIGGCAVSELAATYGTPLYVFDEMTLRGRARAYTSALRQHYPGSAQVAYASKAYLCTALAQLWEQEGLDLDVVSAGELHVALRAGVAPERIHFHGNNKTPEELAQALAAGVSRIVVDNFHELALLTELTRTMAQPLPIWLRLSPGVQAHTHAHIQTGQVDTKFGFTLATGDAERAVALAMQAPGLTPVGLHSHIGSQIYEADSLAAAATRLAEFAAAMRDRHGFELAELSPGGGWGVPMIESDPDASIPAFVAELSQALVAACERGGLPLPHLVLEPGRSLVAPAAVSLYTIGSRKEIPGVRTYVAVDGGMADNIRPALYGAQYTALRVLARRDATPADPTRDAREIVTVVGKFCETGDILIRDIELPRLAAGNLLAIPMAGAYTLAMASNYNLARRPAVVLVNQGEARLIQRRETLADLAARDLPLAPGNGAETAPRRQRREPTGRTFWKYQALGNDYIVLDPPDWPDAPTPEQIRRICDRHLGVGADGILWGPFDVARSHVGTFGLRLFNPDGGEFEKSGNGLRIFARYLWDLGLPAGPDFEIDTPGGTVVAHVLDDEGAKIAMEMGRLTFDSRGIPLTGPAREVVEERVQVNGRAVRITAAGIGNPHCVAFLDGQSEGLGDLTPDLARTLGPSLEQLSLYPHRTNVQFAQAIDRHTLRIEIWERGAGYTLASGTSSCAAAGAAIRTGRCQNPVTVQMPGGTMLVEVAPDWSVRLTGTVGFVCRGQVNA
jgi:diaminopimelate decarboxylase